MISELDFRFDDLYDGCLLSSIFNAITNIRNPILGHTKSWDALNYSFQADNSRGTISFDLANRIVAGALRSETSPRIAMYPEHESIELFEDALETVKELARNEALQYIFCDINGIEMPVATTLLDRAV